MGKGRKPNTALPACKFLFALSIFHAIHDANGFSVVELSDDSKKVRCKICDAVRGQNNSWIQKESLAYHLKSDVHARSIGAQQNREDIRRVGEQSMQEREMEERMDFVTLSSTINPSIPVMARIHKPSTEEQEMWDNHALSNEVFDAGIDHTVGVVEERKRLEREANIFNLWHGADFLPEEDPDDSELLLDELEQDDILTELLRNASMYAMQLCSYISMLISFSDRLEGA
jgi:hypothetical protein